MSFAPEPQVMLVPVNRGNYAHMLALQVAEDQQRFAPHPATALVEAHFEGLEALAIYHENTAVGLLVAGSMGGVPWITRLLVDHRHQGQGLGQAAIRAAVLRLRKRHAGATEVRTTVALQNALAEHVFTRAGFRRSAQIDQHELVLHHPLEV